MCERGGDSFWVLVGNGGGKREQMKREEMGGVLLRRHHEIMDVADLHAAVVMVGCVYLPNLTSHMVVVPLSVNPIMCSSFCDSAFKFKKKEEEKER